jgi:hypothetical protein
MEVSAEAVAKVPGENLRVSRVDFGALWALAEQLGSLPARGDQYLIACCGRAAGWRVSRFGRG